MNDEANALLTETRWLRRLARSVVRDVDLADDVFQETMAAALRSPAGGDRPWLARVTRNLAVSLLRREARRQQVEGLAAKRRLAAPTSELVAEAELQRAGLTCS